MDSLFFDLGLVIVAAALIGVVSYFLKQPLILAYIVAGVLIGPFGFGFIHDIHVIHIIAEVGIMLMLFLVGLEMNPDRLKDLGVVAFAVGIGQVLFTAIFGFGLGEMEMPPPVDVNLERLYDKFQAGFAGYDSFWKDVLSTNLYKKLSEVKTLSFANFEFPANLWADVLIDFALAYKNGACEKDKLMGGLIPLYFGRTCSFVVELEPMTIQQAEEVIEDQCIVFERSKPGLLTKWFDTK